MPTTDHTLSRRAFAGSALALAAGSLSTAALANAYPNRPIRLIVPYAPGGGSDMVGRLIAQKLTETAGWNVVVDNKAGASSLIGTDAAAKSAAEASAPWIAMPSAASGTSSRPEPHIASRTTPAFPRQQPEGADRAAAR